MNDEQAFARVAAFLSGASLQAARHEVQRVKGLKPPDPADTDRALALQRWLDAGAVLYPSLGPDGAAPRPWRRTEIDGCRVVHEFVALCGEWEINGRGWVTDDGRSALLERLELALSSVRWGYGSASGSRRGGRGALRQRAFVDERQGSAVAPLPHRSVALRGGAGCVGLAHERGPAGRGEPPDVPVLAGSSPNGDEFSPLNETAAAAVGVHSARRH